MYISEKYRQKRATICRQTSGGAERRRRQYGSVRRFGEGSRSAAAADEKWRAGSARGAAGGRPIGAATAETLARGAHRLHGSQQISSTRQFLPVQFECVFAPFAVEIVYIGRKGGR